MISKLKLFLLDRRREVVVFVLFFLISTISFSLGYILAGRSENARIVIEKTVPLQAQ
jgi:hypothetical protein